MTKITLENIGYHPFDVSGESTSKGSRWKEWLHDLKHDAIARGVTADVQKKNLLLVCAGTEV